MGGFYDIYGFSKNRNKETIDKFIAHYANRKEVENCGNCELVIQKYKKYISNELLIPVKTLSEVIDYGIKNKNHGYAFYLPLTGLKEDIKSVILKFTYDSSIIFGLSIEAESDSEEDNYLRAFELETEMRELFFTVETSIQFEYPPSEDEEDFKESKKAWEEMNKEGLKQISRNLAKNNLRINP